MEGYLHKQEFVHWRLLISLVGCRLCGIWRDLRIKSRSSSSLWHKIDKGCCQRTWDFAQDTQTQKTTRIKLGAIVYKPCPRHPARHKDFTRRDNQVKDKYRTVTKIKETSRFVLPDQGRRTSLFCLENQPKNKEEFLNLLIILLLQALLVCFIHFFQKKKKSVNIV